MDYQTILRALKSLQDEGQPDQVTGGEVMTDVGPGNARAYSQILAGNQTPGTAIPAPTEHSAIAATKPQLPDHIQALSDLELQQLVNKYGSKAVKDGTPRPKLLSLAANALGYAPEPQAVGLTPGDAATTPQAPQQAALPPGPTTSPPPPPVPPPIPPPVPPPIAPPASAIAPPPLPQPPQKATLPAGPIGPSAPPVTAGSAYPNIAPPVVPPRGIPIPERSPQPPVRDETRKLTWSERERRLENSGKMLPADDVAGRVMNKKPTRRQRITESEREEQRSRDQQERQRLMGREQAERNRNIVQPVGTTVPPVSAKAEAKREQEKQQDDLIEALKRLTDSVDKSGPSEATVGDQVKGLSWGERLERLKQDGNLLSEEQVKSNTLKEKITPRDMVSESERQEERSRLRTIRARGSGSRIGRSGPGGPPAAAGRGGAAAAGGRAAAGGGAAGGAVARIASVAKHPVVLLGVAAAATAVVIAKLPGKIERLAGSLLEAQRHLGRYNATIAASTARLDYQKRLLEMETSRATAGSNQDLSNNLMQLRREMVGYKQFATSVKNQLMATVTGFAADLLGRIDKGVDAIPELSRGIDKLVKWFMGDPTPGDDLPAIRYMKLLQDRGRPRNRRPSRDDANHEDD